MNPTIRAKAETLATLRYIQVFLMETLARWVPSTPELEVKVLFSRHLWDLAQQADAVGKRTYEMRATLHFTLPPSDSYLKTLEEFSSITATAERLAAFYEAVLPGLEARYRRYLDSTDALMDEPTVRILLRALDEGARMKKEWKEVTAQLPEVRLENADRVKALAARESGDVEIVRHGSLAAAASGGA